MMLMPPVSLIHKEVKTKLTEKRALELQVSIKVKLNKEETKEIGVKLETINSTKEKTGLIWITPWEELTLKLGDKEV